MADTITTDGRQHERYVANGVATIHTASAQATGPLVDVSEGGLKILCRIPVSVGERVEVRFTPEGYSEEIRARGRVTRILADGVGIEFTPTSLLQAGWRKILAFFTVQDRIYERYPAEGEATISIASNRAEGRVENVSRGGMQIRCAIPADVGDRVEVRYTPRGQSEEITVAGRVARRDGNCIGIGFPQTSTWDASWRKLVAFRTVKQDKAEIPPMPAELLERAAAIQKEAARSGDLDVKTKALWKMESLGVTFGRLAQSGDTLENSRLPVEARPIVHVGMGGAAVENADFDREEITRTIDSLAHPEYRLFSYEQIGAMLGVYEKKVPRLMLGLKRLNRPDDTEQFIQSFHEKEARRLISHGYGRLLYFNSKDLRAAWRNIKQRDFLDPRAAVQGMAFGYAMVNHNDLGLVLETGDGLLIPALETGDGSLVPALLRAFKAGLVYALEFWEWASPGVLQSLAPGSRRGEELVAIAREEIESARKRGFLGPFMVERFSNT